ncbi:rhodanese-like domain-containing protein [Ekhidna sp.]|uniref:rhodanese-like domain-containing protein n=1 Tax=Ekhidna sp. TaxID=2608089 RepID=UPI0032EABF9F
MLGLFTGKKKKIEEFIKQGAVIIDVRSKTEFEGGHLRTSKNIPMDSIPSYMGQLDKTKPIITCCASGMRSGQVKRMLKANGFKAMNGGGWMSLEKYGL